MKVFDLRCVEGHGFEGWFGSEDDYVGQAGRGEIACPICGNVQVDRMPSAPRISAHRAEPSAAAPGDAGAQTVEMTMQSHWLRAVRQVLKSTEDVGNRFAEEARRIHYGEAEERGIRGQASRADAAALRAEGIEVMALPIPDALKGPLQ